MPSARIALAPGDFVVEEALRFPPGRTGSFSLYRVTKRLLTTPEVQERLAARLNLGPSDIAFPALKDKNAVATQHCTLRLAAAPERIEGPGYAAQRIGRMLRPLTPGDLTGNRFTITLRALDPPRATAMAARLETLARTGLPNYFDSQRFGSHIEGGIWFGKAVLQGDAEAALKAYLAQDAPADADDLRAMKRFARDHWRDWPAIAAAAPRSNHRSLLTFLADHPQDFRRALNLITPRLLPLLLAQYQSLLWNRIAGRVLEQALADAGAKIVQANMDRITIAGDSLVLAGALPPAATQALRAAAIPLPNQRMDLSGAAVAQAIERVLADEGLAPRDLKARLLQRAYLPRGDRPLLVFPSDTASRVLPADPLRDLQVRFFLPPGSYATLVLKALALSQAA